MEQKSSVSALQEFCAKAKTGNPVYDFIDGEEGGYICKVELMDTEAFGNGRSKRDAKHLAAANIMRKLRKLPGFDSLGSTATVCNNNVDDSVQNEMANMNRDMLKELRDYCVRHDMPLPTIEIVQQSGQPNAPEFVACCSVASIKRYGKSDSKKDARQRAAIEMLCIISTSDKISNLNASTNLVSTKPQNADLDADLEDLESERRRKFKTYRELIDAGGDDTRNIKISDRHNYFKSFYPALKAAAFDVINSQEYVSEKDQLDVLLDVLKLTSKVSQLESTSMEPLLQLELKCDFNCMFIGLESVIYKQIIQYLRDMLI
ncbi:uncharacterized protein LOC133835140 [Drosophila sulfurigaster albostrigata]|uniref:uncharacterized protein LOC133835140 n=1 Tax=Drosophila sulfurigaster albostrigata TaxID=89887 RepID=UPI002D21CF04|nr:uncharacterized protein LOC133835140 [Drosophila sulfurigaster albostrigata]